MNSALWIAMLAAMAAHARRHDYPPIGADTLLLLLAAFVADGRFFLIAAYRRFMRGTRYGT